MAVHGAECAVVVCAGAAVLLRQKQKKRVKKMPTWQALLNDRYCNMQDIKPLLGLAAVPATTVWIDINPELALQRNREPPPETRLPEIYFLLV